MRILRTCLFVRVCVRGSNSDTYSHHGSCPGSRQIKDIHIHTRLSLSLSPPSVHKRKKAHAAVHQQCQTVCLLCCPTNLDWRKKCCHRMTPHPRRSFLHKSSRRDEYFMDTNFTVGNTSKNLVLHSLPHFARPRLCLENKEDYFALDVDISPSLSAFCELIGLLWVRESDWGLLCTVMINVLVFKGSSSASLLPPVLPHFTHHFAIIHSSHLISPSVHLALSLSATFSPFFLSVSLSRAALFTVWKCLKLPATTYYKMHSSRAWISVWLWQPRCILGKRQRGRRLGGEEEEEGEERRDWGEGLCPTVRAPCGGVRC